MSGDIFGALDDFENAQLRDREREHANKELDRMAERLAEYNKALDELRAKARERAKQTKAVRAPKPKPRVKSVRPLRNTKKKYAGKRKRK